MRILIVVNNPEDWPLQTRGVDVVAARRYLTDPDYSKGRDIRVFNLCRSYRYQSVGYYVSLLAEARGHKPLPSVTTIQDMKSLTIVRLASDELDEIIQESLAPIHDTRFTLSIYFGQNVAKRHERLSRQLFNSFQAPLLRAYFVREECWELRAIGPIPASEVPENHRDFVVNAAQEYFTRRHAGRPRRSAPRYDLAILHDPGATQQPSNAKALQRFEKAAHAVGLGVDLVTKDDYAHVAEYDALFIRETTSVNHHTYRFARRAAAEGLVVVDDPASILKCCNKVYLAELLERHEVRTPRTIIAHRDNVDAIIEESAYPLILKQPDGSFSQGVCKVNDAAELQAELERMFERSELVIVQEFVPTQFDWRVGVFDGHPLFVCKYYMADNHWQIVKRESNGDREFGRIETLPVEHAPEQVVRTALKAANLIGDGLYGVDLKQHDRDVYVIEVNDNPNIDAGYEDAVLKDELYKRIMRVFLRRLERRSEGEA